MVFALPTCGGRRHERRERIRRRRQDPRTAMVSSGPILMRGKWTRIKGAAICSIQIYLHFFIISRWRSGLGDVFSTSHLGWGDVLADFLCHLRLIEILGVPLGTWFVQPLLQSRFASFNLWIVKKHAGYVDMKIECDSHGDTWNVQFPPTGADSFLASMSDAHTHTCSQPCWSVICLRSSLSDICFTHIYIYIYMLYLSWPVGGPHYLCILRACQEAIQEMTMESAKLPEGCGKPCFKPGIKMGDVWKVLNKFGCSVHVPVLCFFPHLGF